MIYIYRSVYDQICFHLFSHSPEHGGVLGATENGTVTRFYFDSSGTSGKDSYTPDYRKINEILDIWAEDGVEMAGMVHSHDDSCQFPSCGDLFYCEQILLNNPLMERFLLPIAIIPTKQILLYIGYLENKRIKVRKDVFCILDDAV